MNGMQQKVDSLNPVFLLTMETRLEDLHRDIIELRNLYSSPTSSLNLVLDGLLKKVKDLEAGDLATQYATRDRSPRKLPGGGGVTTAITARGNPDTSALMSPTGSRNGLMASK